MEEIKVEQSVSSQLKDNKNNSFLVMLLSILLLISVFIAGFFAWKTQQLVKELRTMNNDLKSTPIATATSTSDPTVDWKIYTSDSFVFKYPNANWEIMTYDNNKNSLYLKNNDPDKKYYSIDFYEISNSSIEKALSDPYIAGVERDPTLDKNLTIDGRKSLMITGLGSAAITPRQKSTKTLIQNNRKVVSINLSYESDLDVYNQILSTFKFIEPEASSTPLPVACTMDAKICPDGSAVGRSGPKCEFAACPTTSPLP